MEQLPIDNNLDDRESTLILFQSVLFFGLEAEEEKLDLRREVMFKEFKPSSIGRLIPAAVGTPKLTALIKVRKDCRPKINFK